MTQEQNQDDTERTTFLNETQEPAPIETLHEATPSESLKTSLIRLLTSIMPPSLVVLFADPTYNKLSDAKLDQARQLVPLYLS